MTAGIGKKRLIAYWLLTGLVLFFETGASYSMISGSSHAVEGLERLGYPPYILMILGPLKLAGVITLALPRLPRLKEWAYAGFAFDFIGAFASHAFLGDGLDKLMPPVIILSVLIGSYLLRPASRRLV